MFKTLYILLICIFFCGCNQSIKENKKNSVSLDSLKIAPQTKINLNSAKEIEIYNKYYTRFGIAIQNYFKVIDSVAIDLNQDKLIDTVLIVSPISLDDPTYYNSKYDSVPKRLLIEVLNANGKGKIRHQYENVISDVGGVLFSYLGLSKTVNGFEISHGAGNKASWTYNVEYTNSNPNNLTINRISKLCSYEDTIDSLVYSFKEYSLLKFNIQDTIKANCNCDNVWKKLIQKQ